jgi:hypothetical protein
VKTPRCRPRHRGAAAATGSGFRSGSHRLLTEAQHNGWEGEAAGLEDTLGHIADKKAQLQRIQAGSSTPVWLTLSPART